MDRDDAYDKTCGPEDKHERYQYKADPHAEGRFEESCSEGAQDDGEYFILSQFHGKISKSLEGISVVVLQGHVADAESEFRKEAGYESHRPEERWSYLRRICVAKGSHKRPRHNKAVVFFFYTTGGFEECFSGDMFDFLIRYNVNRFFYHIPCWF